MPSDSTPPLSASGQDEHAVPEDESDAAEWRREYRQFVHGRVAQTQAQAQSWLGVMSTLLGLFSAVVVIGHGTAINELPVGTGGRGLVFVLAVVAYGLAIRAVVYGAQATWGGLGLGPPPTTGEATAQKRSTPPGQEDTGFRSWWSPTPLAEQLPSDTWEEYRDSQLELADKLRRRLHRSRLLGVAAVLLAGILAMAVLGFGAFVHPAQAPTSVVVVHDGQVTCGSINIGAGGQTQVGDRVISQATQVVVVSHC
jgi:hypothetical protein